MVRSGSPSACAAPLALALCLALFFAPSLSSAESSGDHSCAAVVAAADEWLEAAGVAHPLLTLDPSARVVAAEEIKPRTVVQHLPKSVVFGWDVEVEGEGWAAEEAARRRLAALLLEELNAPSTQWAPFLRLLQAQIPRWRGGEDGAEAVRESVCPCGWGMPALLWSEEELSPAAETLLPATVAAWRDRLAEALPRQPLADALWAYSVALARSFTVYDDGARHLVLAPFASNLALGLRARTTFAYSGADGEVRFWVDDLYLEGDEVAALYAPLTSLELVLFFGYHEQINPLERVPLDVFLDVHDKQYEEKRAFLLGAGVLEEEEFPMGRTLYADVTGMVSPETMALLRLKHYDAAKHVPPPAQDPRQRERKKNARVLAEHQLREEGFPSPMAVLHKANELAAVQDLAATLNSRLARHFSTDLASDQAAYARPPSAGQQLDKQRLNLLAVRIVEKELLGKAHRRLSRKAQQLTSEALHGAKKPADRPRQRANLDAFKLQRSTLLD